jgi:hypothetical protein
MSKATIVVCEGDDGWEDYLLLHHLDPEDHSMSFVVDKF